MKCFFVLFVFLALGTVLSHKWIDQYEVIGPDMLTDQWQIRAGTDCQGVVQNNGLCLESQKPLKSISICQEVTGAKAEMTLLLSATMRCEKVTPGSKPWNRARLLLVQNDGKKERWDFPHTVGKPFEGTMNWKRFGTAFTVNPLTEKLRVVAQMSQCRGRFELKDIHLVPVIERPAYVWAKRVVLLLWALFGFVFVISFFFLTRRSTLLNVVLGLAFAGIIIGTTMPSGMKNQIIKKVKAGAAFAKETIVSADKQEIPWQPDKVGHFCLFALFGYILISVLEQDAGFTALVYTLMVAAGTELAQIYIDGRSGHLSDFFIDAAGGCLGIMIALLGQRLNNKRIKGGGNDWV